MAVPDQYRVRPSPEKETRDAFKILLSPSALLLLGMKPGGLCRIKTSQGLIGPAIVWNASEKIKDDVVQTSKALQKLYGLKLDTRISISRSNELVADASEITMHEVTQFDSESKVVSLDETERIDWAIILKFAIRKVDILAPGIVLDVVEPEKRAFQIQQINASDELVLYRAQRKSEIRVVGITAPDDKPHPLFVASDGLGGLTTQMQQINDKISFYNETLDTRPHLPDWFRPCDGGLIIYGALGTGKSLVLQKISEAGWRGVFHLDTKLLDRGTDESEAAVIRVFTNALESQPSVIIIDPLDFDGTTQNDQESGRSGNMNRLLCEQLDRVGNNRTFVVGATKMLSNVAQNLRRAKRFAKQIEIPIPDSNSRAEILKVLCKLPQNDVHPTLDSIAARAHGFVGADLELLVETAVELYLTRIKKSSLDGRLSIHEQVDLEVLLANMKTDFDAALLYVHPTAMQNIFIESPNVRWTDIGGQHEVKKVLEKALVWPFKVIMTINSSDYYINVSQYSEILRKHKVKQKKGVLLYGPPGCSKTMTAKAAATESGLNFLAVKGAELTSMYVGESERKLRDLFSKARAVRPSVIFFDEIDAIGATGELNTNGGVQTVTTLLNELDGFQALEGVYVILATNKPEALHPALIRAGRLDACLYIGPPDFEARRDILTLGMRDMQLGHDIDISALSEAAKGFSGAEMAGICEQARDSATEEEIETQKGQLVCQRHFMFALTKVQKSITPEMVRRYEAWGAGRH